MKFCLALTLFSSVSAFVTIPRSSGKSTTTIILMDSVGGRMIPGVNEKTDMNKYNVGFEPSVEQWTANVMGKTQMQEEGIYLGVKDNQNLFADNLKFEVSRNGGLGIELLEIAGGREDGVGITVCSGLVPGGNAEFSGIEPGDSIVSLQVAETEISQAVSTECFGYDKTVDAIINLSGKGDKVIIGVKRVRRKPKVELVLQFPPSSKEPDQYLELFAGENLRRAMLVRGVKLNDALSRRFDSGGTGDCGAEVCKIIFTMQITTSY